jgi:hypothetical protein
VRAIGLLILVSSIVRAAGAPMTLLSEDEAEPIHSAILRKEAWTQDAVRRLRQEAEKRMREGVWSVTSDRPVGLRLDPHDYYSEAPYWWPNPADPGGPYIRQDGRFNPDRFVANRNALNAMCDAVFTLGTAAFLLDDARYGERAAHIVNAWFVNPKTRMNPNLEHAQAVRGVNLGRSDGVLDGRAFIRAIQGIEFLAQTRAWDAKDQAAVDRWFVEYLSWLTNSDAGMDERDSGNNHASWWTAQTAAVATFVENKAVEQAVFRFYRDRIFPRQIKADGSAPREEERTRSLSYSVFNLEAYATICRIAEVQGVDLWHIEGKRGATLATVIGYLTPYLSDTRKWNKEQITEFQSDSLDFLAFAGMGLKEPAYIALYQKLARSVGAWTAFIDLIVGRWEAAAHQTRH